MNLDCPKCDERWFADGENGQENCPKCGTKGERAKAYDQVASKFVDLPDGWVELQDRTMDVVRIDGKARVLVTGPNGRYAAQQKVGSHWVSICKPGARSNAYFTKLLSAIAYADEHRTV